MKRSKRFEPILRIAERQEQQAMQLLAQRIQALEAVKRKLSDLDQYLADYQKSFIDQGTKGMSGSALQGYQQFMDQLDEAKSQQGEQRVLFEGQVEEARRIYAQVHKKTLMIETLIEKAKHSEYVIEEKQLQKQLDEISMLLVRRQANESK